MRFCVCIKQVPDISAAVQTGRMVLNAYDASAVEEALVLKEKVGGSVDLVLIGPDSAKEVIRKALAMGADSASHIVRDTEGLDSHAVAEMLAHFFRKGERLEDKSSPARRQLLDRLSVLTVRAMVGYFDRYKQRSFVLPDSLRRAWLS